MEYSELVALAKGAKSAAELLALAKEKGVEITEEQAEAYFARLGQGELGEEELAAVSGGGCGGSSETTTDTTTKPTDPYIKKIVTVRSGETCFNCPSTTFRVLGIQAGQRNYGISGADLYYVIECTACGCASAYRASELEVIL